MHTEHTPAEQPLLYVRSPTFSVVFPPVFSSSPEIKEINRSNISNGCITIKNLNCTSRANPGFNENVCMYVRQSVDTIVPYVPATHPIREFTSTVNDPYNKHM